MIRKFAEEVEQLIVVEELDPFIEDQLKALGIAVAHGKDVLPMCGELTLAKVRAGAAQAGLLPATVTSGVAPVDEVVIPTRPPAFCPGCPHRAFFYNMSRLKRKAMIAGDIGCYSMGVSPPFESMDMLISMGASIGMAHGFQLEESERIDIAEVCRALGVKFVKEVDAWDVEAVNKTLRAAMAFEDGPAVLVVRGSCVFTPHFHLQPQMTVNPEKCIACGACFRVGCPAILKSEEVNEKTGKHKAMIDPLLCTGCTVCAQVCPTNAIERESEKARRREGE
jgi:indolepyruvate ferredoxin oxidoreductase alpha subunit